MVTRTRIGGGWRGGLETWEANELRWKGVHEGHQDLGGQSRGTPARDRQSSSGVVCHEIQREE